MITINIYPALCKKELKPTKEKALFKKNCYDMRGKMKRGSDHE